LTTAVNHTVHGELPAAGNLNATTGTTPRQSRSPSRTDEVRVRSLILSLLASAAVFGLPSMPAHSGTFTISPIRLDLSSAADRPH
jgi:hypothetical protein